jgi:CRP/FNR family cyclic AMP-dependent transcriptional regulator
MENLDFTRRMEAAARSAIQSAAQSPLYNPELALEFFRSAGRQEKIQCNTPIFVENEKAGGLFSKSARMYLLLEGEVGLTFRNTVLGVVKRGEIFGELMVISGLPRSATAIAKIDCSALSLNKKEFLAALQKTPEFALMLMSIMGQRLRRSIAKPGAGGSVASPPVDHGGFLDRKMLAKLARELDEQPPASYGTGKVIVSAGAAGAFMYVVMEGRVAISIGDQVVEHVGPGGFFGEMALVDRSPRAATAAAESDCTLLSIGRNDFITLVKAKPVFGALLLKSMAERARQWYPLGILG